MAATRAPLSGGRWHFQHGPIDVVIGADGDSGAVAQAHAAAWRRFRTVLDELVAELPLLRQPIRIAAASALQRLAPVAESLCPDGVIARRMWHACAPFAAQFITPMAAVAGAVAQELIGCYARDGVVRAWVNNGGDIALHLGGGPAGTSRLPGASDAPDASGVLGPYRTLDTFGASDSLDAPNAPNAPDAPKALDACGAFDPCGLPGASVRIGLVADLASVAASGGLLTGATGSQPSDEFNGVSTGSPAAALRPDGHFDVHAGMPVRGVATSGWRGRSFSLGIADSVTVLARTAAQADAAATVIANAVNVDDPRIVRTAANRLKDDTDLGDLEVTVDVPALPPARVQRALLAGQRRARELQRAGLIHSAVIVCQRQVVRVGALPPTPLPSMRPPGEESSLSPPPGVNGAPRIGEALRPFGIATRRPSPVGMP